MFLPLLLLEFRVATLLYIIFKTLRMVDEPNDWVNICQLVAMDSIAIVLLLHWWQRRKA